MVKKLPSLNVLKVFDTAARCGSFKAAADELCLSPSAVSHQIRVLEEQLDTILFERLNRSIKLTPKGAQYFDDIHEAIQLIKQATVKITQDNQKKSITISCIPFVTNHFLIPHLAEFKQNHPEYSIKLLSQLELVDFQSGVVDMGVRYQKQDRSDLEYVSLTDVKLTPVCTADYWQAFQSDKKAFSEHKFISLSIDNKTWEAWLAQFRPDQSIPEFEVELDNYQAVKQAAMQGLGLAMGYFPAVQDEINSGHLIAPYEKEAANFGAMYLVYPLVDKDKESVKMVRDWMESIFSIFEH